MREVTICVSLVFAVHVDVAAATETVTEIATATVTEIVAETATATETVAKIQPHNLTRFVGLS